jgi:hypothetical protein
VKITKDHKTKIGEILTWYDWPLYKSVDKFTGPELIRTIHSSLSYSSLASSIMLKEKDERIDKIKQELKDIGIDIEQYLEEQINKKVKKLADK